MFSNSHDNSGRYYYTFMEWFMKGIMVKISLKNNLTINNSQYNLIFLKLRGLGNLKKCVS